PSVFQAMAITLPQPISDQSPQQQAAGFNCHEPTVNPAIEKIRGRAFSGLRSLSDPARVFSAPGWSWREDGLRQCWRTDEGLTRNLYARSWAMHTVTPSYTRNEAVIAASPQLAASDAFASHADVTLELADLSIGQLSAVAALMLSLDAAEARARSAE